MKTRKAALRIAEALVKAKEGNYYAHGWYSYMNLSDVETLLLAALSPTEAALYRGMIGG